MTPSRAWVTSAAVVGLMACFPPEGARYRTLPPADRTVWIGVGGWCTPWSAMVAYPSAISSGVTAWVPSVIEHTGSSGDRIPMSCAVAATLSGPTSSTSWEKIVFTEFAVASSRVMVPADSSA